MSAYVGPGRLCGRGQFLVRALSLLERCEQCGFLAIEPNTFRQPVVLLTARIASQPLHQPIAAINPARSAIVSVPRNSQRKDREKLAMCSSIAFTRARCCSRSHVP